MVTYLRWTGRKGKYWRMEDSSADSCVSMGKVCRRGDKGCGEGGCGGEEEDRWEG